jgi:hypothetical protein
MRGAWVAADPWHGYRQKFRVFFQEAYLIENLNATWLPVTAARVSLPEAPLSFQRARRALRAWANRQIIFANATPGRGRGET